MVQLSEVGTGLRAEEVLTMQVPLLKFGGAPAGTDQAAWFRQLILSDMQAKVRYEEMRREIAALPGVVRAGVGGSTPLRASQTAFEMKAEGKALGVGEALPRPDFRTADPNYFDAAGIPLLKGRNFDATDRLGAPRVVIINQTLADRLFPNQDPIGKRIAWTGEVLKFTPISPDWRTVVGVVANTRDGGLDAEPRSAMFMPFAQELALGGGFVIRADSNVANLAAAATRIVHRVAPTVPLGKVLTISQIKDQSVAPRRLNAVLIGSTARAVAWIRAVRGDCAMDPPGSSIKQRSAA